jgi:choline transport protein
VVWSVLGVIIISIVLLSTSEKNSAKYVFSGFDNETGWSSGIAWILGMLQAALSLIGSDAATHMSEEMPNPARDTPRAMIYSILVGGVTYVFYTFETQMLTFRRGLGFILMILFCFQDTSDVLASATGMPITEIIFRSTGSRAAASALTIMLAVSFISGTNAAVTTTSRLMFSMARHKGAPFSE